MTCCFFGHRDTPCEVKNRLSNILKELVENYAVECFLVGNEGSFDRMVSSALGELKKCYPNIKCYTVLAYLPTKNSEPLYLETLYPEGLECIPKRFAIDARNRWMLLRADIVVGYVNHAVGGAAKWLLYAKKQEKKVINLIDL